MEGWTFMYIKCISNKNWDSLNSLQKKDMCFVIVFFVLSKTQETTLFVDIFQDYGLDVNAFRTLVDDCPQCLLDLSANCCNVGSPKLSKIVFKTYKNTVWHRGNNIAV